MNDVAQEKRQVKLRKEAVFSEDGKLSHIALTYSDGTRGEIQVPASVMQEAAATGALYKLGQLANGEGDLDVLKAAVGQLIEQWRSGEWRQRAEGGQGTSIIMKAIMEFKGVTANTARDFLASKTMQQKIDMKRIKGLDAIVARLEAEEEAKLRAKGKIEEVDESLLEGL